MEPHPDPDLEAFIHRKLRQLPEHEAPSTLVPRVLAALESRAVRPWWQQTWWAWPRAAQAAFVVLVVGLAGLLSGGGWWIYHEIISLGHQMKDRLAPLADYGDKLAALGTWFSTVTMNSGPALLLYGLGLATVMYLICVGLGTMGVRLAWRKT